ncbi:PREDICTED: E3 ubiquitin-protein ligase UBR4-like [Priapulus caudatus]|uniref:E3 ubiquitin-protein ligase UBR4-like n=1 Tax=Priapulus caudatus TaxID=37621 RepID=A0ABM1EE64_PRICU|nr:PREDICTED: E3 ubiquitin-protein ligase UBR4-like [Priapulus caudatus]
MCVLASPHGKRQHLAVSHEKGKALWLPGSQTELAIVTADFVKVYDLAADALSPQYYFLLPSGRLRDCCFVFSDDQRAMLAMSSSGHLYAQFMQDYSRAVHGPFYVTNVIEVNHQDLKDSGGQVAGGGVSVYYSHALQLLFFSFPLPLLLLKVNHQDLSLSLCRSTTRI